MGAGRQEVRSCGRGTGRGLKARYYWSRHVNSDSIRRLSVQIPSGAMYRFARPEVLEIVTASIESGQCRRSRCEPRRGGSVPSTTVLLADDNVAVLNHVREMFGKQEGYEVVAVIADGASVVREYLLIRPDIVLLDISMGEVSGIDVARQLRDAGCSAKIIFLTVHEDSDYVNAAIGAGGSAYVVKSRLHLDLFTAINAALSNKLFVSPTLLFAPGENGDSVV
jgi:CheY-like chemotaxis protein